VLLRLPHKVVQGCAVRGNGKELIQQTGKAIIGYPKPVSHDFQECLIEAKLAVIG